MLYLVGTGTFARVYRAVHQETSQVVALKVLRNRFSENLAQSGQFLREGRVGVHCAIRTSCPSTRWSPTARTTSW